MGHICPDRYGSCLTFRQGIPGKCLYENPPVHPEVGARSAPTLGLLPSLNKDLSWQFLGNIICFMCLHYFMLCYVILNNLTLFEIMLHELYMKALFRTLKHIQIRTNIKQTERLQHDANQMKAYRNLHKPIQTHDNLNVCRPYCKQAVTCRHTQADTQM